MALLPKSRPTRTARVTSRPRTRQQAKLRRRRRSTHSQAPDFGLEKSLRTGLELSDTPDQNVWLLWQLVDSAFPTGGFAHSGGLEAAWQQGEIGAPEELFRFVETCLTQTGQAAVPFLNDAYHQVRSFSELDRLCDAFLSNHVGNRGSRAQGRAFLLTACQSFGPGALKTLRAQVLQENLPCHFAPVLGTTGRVLEIRHDLCVRLFLFMNLRGLLASAVRLGIVGPMAAQAFQCRLARHAERVAVRCAALKAEQATQISPLLDILQGVHDRLYSRLFQT